MNSDRYIHLIYLKLQGHISLEEETILSDWLASSPENVQIQEGIIQSMQAVDYYTPDFKIDSEADYSLLKDKMELPRPEQAKSISIKPRRRWMSIAASVALVVAAFGLWRAFSTPTMEWVALSTSTNEIQEITLDDGSQVWLNENSTLKYPRTFESSDRTVQLVGEAFFEVTKNPNKVFKIETNYTEVEVLGTSFNVEAYPNEAKTTLVVKTGTVKFSEKTNGTSAILKANQKGIFDHKSKIIGEGKSETHNEMAWQSQLLSFRATPLAEVFETLEQHFKVKIDYQTTLKDCPYSMGKQKADLDQILENIVKIFQVSVERSKNGNYLLKGGGC